MKIDKDILNEWKNAELENKHDRAMEILRKKQFADQLKSGLGQQIKENSNKITFIKIPLYKKILNYIKNFIVRL